MSILSLINFKNKHRKRGAGSNRTQNNPFRSDYSIIRPNDITVQSVHSDKESPIFMESEMFVNRYFRAT